MPRKLTIEEVIESFKEKHGNNYDYSLVEYQNNYIPVKIICNKCGNIFEQRPDVHKAGSGCTKCVKISPRKFTQEYVISLFKESHGDRYDYSEFVFEGMDKRSKLKCPKHGDFIMSPDSHRRGTRCKACQIDDMFIKEDIILDRFSKSHGDRYDYSLIDYKGINKKVEIICKEHGSFFQTPESHYKGQGCPSCAKTGYDGTKPGIFYYLNIENGKAFKIGITNNSLRKRYYKPDLDKCEILLELNFEDGYKAAELERLILSKFKDKKWKGEPLLKGTGTYEIFSENILKDFHLDDWNV